MSMLHLYDDSDAQDYTAWEDVVRAYQEETCQDCYQRACAIGEPCAQHGDAQEPWPVSSGHPCYWCQQSAPYPCGSHREA